MAQQHIMQILFEGEAPDNEMERARILAKVEPQIEALAQALREAGLKHEATVHTKRTSDARREARAARYTAPGLAAE